MIVERTVSLPIENSSWPEYTWLDALTLRDGGRGPTYTSMVRVMLRQVNEETADGGTRSSTEVWLMPTRHTQAKEPKRIGHEVVAYSATVNAAVAAAQRAREFVEEALYGNKPPAVNSCP